MIVGCARDSTEDQNTALQVDALRAAHCKEIFTEKKSEKETRLCSDRESAGSDMRRYLWMPLLSESLISHIRAQLAPGKLENHPQAKP